jgi:hypothetical protein
MRHPPSKEFAFRSFIKHRSALALFHGVVYQLRAQTPRWEVAMLNTTNFPGSIRDI